MSLTAEQLDHLFADRDRYAAEASLYEFTRLAWPVLDPGNPFIGGWAIECMAEHLQAMVDGQIRRLLINCPPGLSKSTLLSVMMPSWIWGPRRQPEKRIITASYEKGLATRDLIRGRDLIRSEWFQERWPVAFKDDQDMKTYYANDRTGWRMASSVGASLTGYRGDFVGVDDPHSVKTADSDTRREESLRWFTETLPTRLNDPEKSSIAVIMQRLHERDVSGLIIRDLGPEWVHLCLPMRHEKTYVCFSPVQPPPERGDVQPERMRRVLEDGEQLPRFEPDPEGDLLYRQDPRTEEGELLFPERFPEDAVAELEATLSAHGGSYGVASQLQQRPSPRGGGTFKKDDARFVDKPESGHTARGWDLAASEARTAKRTAGVKMTRTQDGRILVVDVELLRAGPHEVRKAVLRCAEADGRQVRQSIPQDPGQAGLAQKSEFAKLLHGYEVRFSPETGDKEVRATPFAAQWEAGNVYLVRGPWNDAYLAELALFPTGEYSDQVDASSRAYHELIKGGSRKAALTAPIVFERD